MDDEMGQLQYFYNSDQKRTDRREQFRGDWWYDPPPVGGVEVVALEHDKVTPLDVMGNRVLTHDERIAANLLLQLKNGTTTHQKETSLGQLIDNAREFGAGSLFNGLLPCLMHPTLEDQQKLLLLKSTSRILYELDESVRPYVHEILAVIQPLLIDADDQVLLGGRDIIYNLSKAAGLDTMIDAMRPDIHSLDEYVRKATARSFSIVAYALGILALLPFLREACQSDKSWQARHTGVMIVQQIIILIDGDNLLTHLSYLVEIIKPRLKDDIKKVRTIASHTLAALAQAAAPYGIEI